MTQPLAPHPIARGKVRDIYDCGNELLLVASDRISAYDVVLPDPIPHKGEVLTRISAFWFDRLAHIVPNHLVTIDPAACAAALAGGPAARSDTMSHNDLGRGDGAPAATSAGVPSLAGRAMLVRKATPLPVECIVRGYLTGSGKASYDANGTVCGIALPADLTEASKLPEPLFTPSTKAAQGEHDANITFAECASIVGTNMAARLRDLSCALYLAGATYAAARGIIIADTKFEFGLVDDELVLIDECLTPDSSRFWPASTYSVGHAQPSYDKQYVRDWLRANWNMTGEPPHLPAEVIAGTTKRYAEAYELICGEPFVPWT